MENKGKIWPIVVAILLVLSLIGSCNESSGGSSKSGSKSSEYRCSNCGGDGWDSANGCSCVWCGGDGRTSWNP